MSPVLIAAKLGDVGLDAVVFRSAASLSRLYGVNVLEVDRTTGEALSLTGGTVPRDGLFAAQARLGNVAEIAALREAILENKLPEDSIVLSRILVSGSHAGDVVEVRAFPTLGAELAYLSVLEDSRLSHFLRAVGELLLVGAKEGNPIVFV